ncbi:MAG: hypothetical protein Fur005_01800 [Roseiflexaceae bacterium]
MRGKLFWLALLGGIAWLLYRALRQSQQLVPVRYTPTTPAPTTTASVATVPHAAAPEPEPVVAVPVPPAPPVLAPAEADLVVEAYCVRCKERRLMENPEETITANGRHAMRGSCPLCGAKLFRFVAG